MSQNGTAPPASIWDSSVVRELLKYAVAPFMRAFAIEFTVRGLTLRLVLSPATGTTVSLTFKEPEEPCPSPDLEPNQDPSTVTGTPV